tara:strand:- start:4664 stop:5761 length:1098 start_codon:yes stop_codon:yes gene_type:complete
MIPFFNYQSLFKENEEEYIKIIKDVCSRGAYILQKDLEEFEKNAAAFINVKHLIGVANGTDAIWLGLKALGISSGDEIILPSHTYIASAAAIHFIGAKPILAECGNDNMLDINDIERRITNKTKAIMAVQINGRCCDMDRIKEIAERYKLLVVEDSAQAFGARYKNTYAGTFGAFGTFSFYPAKLLGSFGDGGALVTNDDKIANKVRLLRDHGRDSHGNVIEWGFNSRLDNLQAAILNHKLNNFPNEIIRRREIASMYHKGLNKIKELRLPEPPMENSDYFDVFQNYELRAKKRNKLKIFLEDNGVKTIIQWAGSPVHSFKNLGFSESLPKTEEFFTECIMLPMNITLKDEDINYIIQKIKKFYK